MVPMAAMLAACSQGTSAEHPGKQTYERYCFSCHAAGVAGAPKLGDAEAWTARIELGEDVLLQSTLEGIPPGMPPMGLCNTCSEERLRQAIDYMILAVP